MAHTYSHLCKLRTTSLRLFNVYGTYDRLGMALQKFTRAIMNDELIKIFNFGKHPRDFIYINNIIMIIERGALHNPDWDSTKADSATSKALYRVYNIGNSKPLELMDYINAVKISFGKTAKKKILPLQLGAMPDTYVDVNDLVEQLVYRPSVSVKKEVAKFTEWYGRYYV